MLIKEQKRENGFSIVEMIVAIGLFIAVMVASIGSLMVMVDANRKAQTMRIAIESLSLAMEDMTRAIRQGTFYHCVDPNNTDTKDEIKTFEADPHLFKECVITPSPAIIFEAFDGDNTDITDQVVYYHDNVNKKILKSEDWATTWDDITHPNIVIDRLDFYVSPSDPMYTDPTPEFPIVDSDNRYPRVLVVVGGEAQVGEVATDFTYQMTVAQRSRVGN